MLITTAALLGLAVVGVVVLIVLVIYGGLTLADKWFGTLGAVIWGVTFFYVFMVAALYFVPLLTS